jgi:hypothetical protein
MIIKPRIMPRNFTDIILGFPIGIIQVSVLFLLPFFVVSHITGSSFAGLLVMVCFYIIFTLFTVWHLNIDENGINFKRKIGFPNFIKWQDILSVELVSRKELIIKGWLWPLFPAKEMTPSLSCSKHFKIKWTSGFCYFPPKDIEKFQNIVNMYIQSNNLLQRTYK